MNPTYQHQWPPPAEPNKRILFIAAAVALICAVTMAVFLVNRHEPAGGRPVGEAVAALRQQPATAVQVGYFDPRGSSITGSFTVTADGTASGKLTDPVTGAADYVAGDGEVAVRGDTAWWSRRAPKQVGGVQKRWVTPTVSPFPVDVPAAFGPAGLADTVQRILDGGTPAPVDGGFRGRPATGFERDGWTVLLTEASPHRVLWLGGPLTAIGPIKPVRLTNSKPGFRYAFSPLAVPEPPYVSVTVPDVPAGAERTTREAVAKVLPPAAPAAGQATAPPPEQAAVIPKAPAFEATVNAGNCTGPTCSWTVTVTNTGNAAGQASVIATASPGMPTRTIVVGTLKPGQSRTTPPMTFPNPAPAVPGRNTQVSLTFTADVFSPQLNGPAPAAESRLRNRGLDPATSTTLRQLDPAQYATALKALDVMSRRSGFNPATVMGGVEKAITQGALPELQALVRSGRLENPQDLAEKLNNLTFEIDPDPSAPQPADDRIGYRREIQVAAQTLRTDPNARVLLDGVQRVNGRNYRVDVLIRHPASSGSPDTAIQAKTVSSTKLVGNLKTALKQLNGRGGVDRAIGAAESAPPGSTRVALLFLEPAAGRFHAASRADLERLLGRVARSDVMKDWCVDGRAQADEVVMVNQVGTHRWTKAQMSAVLRVDVPCA